MYRKAVLLSIDLNTAEQSHSLFNQHLNNTYLSTPALFPFEASQVSGLFNHLSPSQVELWYEIDSLICENAEKQQKTSNLKLRTHRSLNIAYNANAFREEHLQEAMIETVYSFQNFIFGPNISPVFELNVVHDNNLIQLERYWDVKCFDQTPDFLSSFDFVLISEPSFPFHRKYSVLLVYNEDRLFKFEFHRFISFIERRYK